MQTKQFTFGQSTTNFHFDSRFEALEELVGRDRGILVTDENIRQAHRDKFEGWKKVIIRPGEENKTQATADWVIKELVKLEADRGSTLVGIGGGVVTDLTGYVAAVYMRGVSFGFVPTSILGMVDAAIGGKNGVDVDNYKNLVGTIKQPHFILYDLSFLDTLPRAEWINGFAEIIKHACIQDQSLFEMLERNSLNNFLSQSSLLATLITRNVEIKAGIVQKDELEKNERRLLNFGHTLGHALERKYKLMHGEAISIGMVKAAEISQALLGFQGSERISQLLNRYHLPTTADFDVDDVIETMRMDKKRENQVINYVLLEKIGSGVVKPINFSKIKELFS